MRDRHKTPQAILPFCPAALTDLSTASAIKTTLIRKLSPRDQLPGYIYAYTSPLEPSMIKIGLTTDEGIRPVKGPGGIQRIQDQVYDCNRNFVCVYPAQSQGGAKARLVQFAYRVEELIMAEHVKCWREVFCTECLKFHKEWFETSIEHGIAVIEKYSAYANTGPYFDPGDGAWQLKFRHWMEKRAVCEPLSLTKTTPGSAGKHIARIEVEETDIDSDDDSYSVYT